MRKEAVVAYFKVSSNALERLRKPRKTSAGKAGVLAKVRNKNVRNE
jgi:hypothetical protein